MYAFRQSICRWDRGLGEDISSQTYKFWNTNEPDVAEFDYSTRPISPLSETAQTACGNNPTFTCSVSSTFSCGSVNEANSDGIVNPSNTISLDIVSKIGIDSCSTGAASGCTNKGIFVSFDLIKATTEDASPACTAMFGPDIISAAQSGQDINTCSKFFQDHTTDTLLGKWADLKCNQKTRALVCNLGIKIILLI